jgi:hypothetical protein
MTSDETKCLTVSCHAEHRIRHPYRAVLERSIMSMAGGKSDM